MSIFGKFKNIFGNKNKPSPTTDNTPTHKKDSPNAQSADNQSPSDEAALDKQPMPDKTEPAGNKEGAPDSDHYHQYPVTKRFIEWIEDSDWHFVHDTPDEDDKDRTHHLVMGFLSNSDSDNFSWRCIIRIQERNQLVVMYGMITQSISQPHFLDILTTLAQINSKINFGSLELDMNTGNVRAKLAFDAEFTTLSKLMMHSYMQALATMTETCHQIVSVALQDDEPSQTLDDLLARHDIDWDTSTDDITDNDVSYFVPTHNKQ